MNYSNEKSDNPFLKNTQVSTPKTPYAPGFFTPLKVGLGIPFVVTMVSR